MDEFVTSSQETIVSSEEETDVKTPPYCTQQDVRFNCKEKIIFIVDTCSEMGDSYYGVDENGGNKKRSKIFWVKECIEMFLLTKSSLNPNNEFAISLLQGSGYLWYQEFTKDVKLLVDTLADVENGAEAAETFSMDDVFNHICINCALPSNDTKARPEFVLRVILIYGRSKCQLDLSRQGEKFLKKMQLSPYFFLDTLYLPCEDNMQEISTKTINWLCELDVKDNCYVLEASENPAKLFECMAKLLAHPLQRSYQTDICHDL